MNLFDQERFLSSVERSIRQIFETSIQQKTYRFTSRQSGPTGNKLIFCKKKIERNRIKEEFHQY